MMEQQGSSNQGISPGGTLRRAAQSACFLLRLLCSSAQPNIDTLHPPLSRFAVGPALLLFFTCPIEQLESQE
jgi:hypothetical protein